MRFFAACSACSIELAVVMPGPGSPSPPRAAAAPGTGPVRSIIGATGELEPASPIPAAIEMLIDEPAARSSCFSFKLEFFERPPELELELEPAALVVVSDDEPVAVLVVPN